MKPLFVGALIAGGAYFLLKDNIAAFLTPAAPAPATPVTPSTTPATPATPAAATITPAAAILATLRSHISAGGNGALLSTAQGPDTWNFYLMQAFPSYSAPAPEAIFPGKANVREPITLDVWYAAVAPHFPAVGLSGAPRQAEPIRYRSGRQAWS